MRDAMTRYTHSFLTRVLTVEGHDGFSGTTRGTHPLVAANPYL
jgi:hypothetical protein